MQVFSPNMLKTFFECEKKYELKYIRKVNMPQHAEIFEKGKKIHALAHYYLRGDAIEKFLPTLTAEEKFLWQRLLNNEYFRKNYVNSEYNLTARLDDFWFGGRLDAFMKTGSDYYILDYKTGTVPKNPEKDFQTMIYLICADKILEKGWGNNFNLNFVYINLKEGKNHLIEFCPELKTLYTKELINAGQIITAAKSYTQTPDRCKFCEYNKLCRGSAL